VITESSLDCYTTLGILHDQYNPLPGTTIKDYIAIPRTNGYQALHTYILYNENVYPIQIRTERMEQISQYGVLQQKQESSRSRYRGWIKRLKQWVQDESNARHMLKGIQDLAEQDQIYVCTPQGDYLGFPRGAIVLDFAYRIHTDIGHHCKGALIDEKPTGIFQELVDGSMVEIVQSETRQIQPDWVDHTTTPRARSAIRNWLEQQKRIRSREFGQQFLKIALDRVKINLDELENSQEYTDALETLGVIDSQDLYYKIGRGIITLKNVLKVLLSPDLFKHYQKGGMSQFSRMMKFLFNRNKDTDIFQIRNVHDPYLKFSLCCNPMPGENIVGVLSIQHGLSVHREECPQLNMRQLDQERIIRLAWSAENLRQSPLLLTVTCQKKPKVTAAILNILETHNVPIRNFQMLPDNNRISVIVEILSSSTDYSDRIHRLIKNEKGVIRVERSQIGKRDIRK